MESAKILLEVGDQKLTNLPNFSLHVDQILSVTGRDGGCEDWYATWRPLFGCLHPGHNYLSLVCMRVVSHDMI